MKTKPNFMKKLMLFTAAFAFCAVLCGKPVDANAAVAAPTDVHQTTATKTSFDMEWTAVPNADGYVTQYSLDQVTWSAESTTSKPSKYFYSLSAGRTYFVRVRSFEFDAKYNKVYSNYSQVFKADTCPDVVTSLSQTGATNNTVTYAWNAVAGATGYALYKALPSDTYWTEVGKTTATSYTLTVPANSKYAVAVLPYRNAANANNLCAASYETSIYCFASPSAPNGLAVSAGNPKTSTLEFYWEPTATLNNTDGYEIEIYQLNKNGKTKRLKKLTKASFGYGTASTGYYNYTEYKNKKMFTNAIRFRVRAYKQLANGTKLYSPWSSYKNYVPQAKYTLKTINNTSSKLKWTKVKNAASYDIYYKASKTGKWKRIKKNVKGTSAVVKSKMYANNYYYVKANKVKFGKKKLSSSHPKQAPYLTYYYIYKKYY